MPIGGGWKCYLSSRMLKAASLMLLAAKFLELLRNWLQDIEAVRGPASCPILERFWSRKHRLVLASNIASPGSILTLGSGKSGNGMIRVLRRRIDRCLTLREDRQ